MIQCYMMEIGEPLLLKRYNFKHTYKKIRGVYFAEDIFYIINNFSLGSESESDYCCQKDD